MLASFDNVRSRAKRRKARLSLYVLSNAVAHLTRSLGIRVRGKCVTELLAIESTSI